MRRGILGAVLVAGLVTGAVHVAIRDLPRQGDEGHHFRQVQRFCSGEATLEPRLTTFPGFHALATAAAAPLGRCGDVAFLRLVNAVFGAAGIVLFHLARRRLGEEDLLRTAQFAALPVLAPYHGQIYTDSLATTIAIGAILLLVCGRTRWASLVAAAGILVRQTSAAWLGFVLLQALLERSEPWSAPRARLVGWLRAVWPGLAGVAAFSAFVLVHGGVALKERKAHPVGLHTGNLWLFLGLCGLILLPHALRTLHRLSRPVLAAAIAAAAAFYVSFGVDHPYNRFEGFLRNDMLLRVEAAPSWRAGAALAIALGTVALFGWAARRGGSTRLPPAAWPALGLTALVPWLIEHRYAAIPLAVLLLYAPRQERAVEAAGAAWSAALTTVLVAGLVQGRWLL